MATKRTPLNRERRRISETVLAALTDAPCPEGGDDIEHADLRYMESADAADLWAAYGEAIVTQWAAERPGTRPTFWWRYSAPRWTPRDRHRDRFYGDRLPEPRTRLGGTGTPAHEVLAYVPRWPLGIPSDWIAPGLAKHYGAGFAGVAIDPEDPPIFEAEAAYLERHGLLLDGETDRLPADAFEPEMVVPHGY